MKERNERRLGRKAGRRNNYGLSLTQAFWEETKQNLDVAFDFVHNRETSRIPEGWS